MTDLQKMAAKSDVIGGFPFVHPDCRGCGKPLTVENAWMADGCPCNSELGVNNFNETRWRMLMQLQQNQSRENEQLQSRLDTLAAENERLKDENSEFKRHNDGGGSKSKATDAAEWYGVARHWERRTKSLYAKSDEDRAVHAAEIANISAERDALRAQLDEARAAIEGAVSCLQDNARDFESINGYVVKKAGVHPYTHAARSTKETLDALTALAAKLRKDGV